MSRRATQAAVAAWIAATVALIIVLVVVFVDRPVVNPRLEDQRMACEGTPGRIYIPLRRVGRAFCLQGQELH